MFRMKKNERNDLEEKPFCLWTLARSREPAALAKKISILALLLNLGTVTIPITKDRWLKLQFNGVSLNCLNPPQSKKRNKTPRFFTYKVWRCERQVKIRIVRLGGETFCSNKPKIDFKGQEPPHNNKTFTHSSLWNQTCSWRGIVRSFPGCSTAGGEALVRWRRSWRTDCGPFRPWWCIQASRPAWRTWPRPRGVRGQSNCWNRFMFWSERKNAWFVEDWKIYWINANQCDIPGQVILQTSSFHWKQLRNTC